MQQLHYEKVVLNNQKIEKEKEDLMLRNMDDILRRKAQEDYEKRSKYQNVSKPFEYPVCSLSIQELEKFKEGVGYQLREKSNRAEEEKTDLRRSIEDRLKAVISPLAHIQLPEYNNPFRR